MYELTNLVKAIAINRAYLRNDVNDNEHFTVQNKSGSVIHLYPSKGIGRVMLNTIASNDYFYSNYSRTSNCLYYWNQDGLELLEYNIETGEKNFYNMHVVGGYASTAQSEFLARYPILPYGGYVSTDDHIYLSCLVGDSVYGYLRFNVTTKEFDEHSVVPDKEFTHIHMRNRNHAFYIDTGAFAGVYSSYIWTESSDGYTHLRDTIVAEIGASGLSWPNSNLIFLHQDDRELVSATRRIYTPIGAGNTWKIIDIKSPSTWINTQRASSTGFDIPKTATCIDQANAPVSTTNWSVLLFLYGLATEAGLTLPTLSVGIAHATPRLVGRFIYVGHHYLGAQTYFYNFVIHPDTGEAVYTYSFNKYDAYSDNQDYLDYKCNFGGDFGFSSSDEIVRFLTDNIGNYYFFRPDTKVFQAYNPITDPDDYVIRRVFLDTPTDVDGVGIYIVTGIEENIDDLEYYTDSTTGISTIALAVIYNQELKSDDIADVTYRVLPDKTSPDKYVDITVKNLYVNTSALSHAIPITGDKVAAIGEVYSGYSMGDIVSEDFVLKKYLGGAISPNGAIKSGNYIFVYGYSGVSNIIDFSDWNNIVKESLSTGQTNEVTYATVRPEGILALGQASRSSAYYTGCAFSIVDVAANTVTGITSLFPNEFNFRSAVDLRSLTALSDPTYSDVNVESAIQAYMTSSGKSRATVIAEFLNTARWGCADAHTYGTKTVVGLSYNGVLGLSGIRIRETLPSGTWIDQTYYQNEGGKALFIDTSDILTLAPSEIKPVQFTLAPNVQEMGRVAGSDNYLAFIVNDPTNEQGIIRVVTKTDFETAANGSGEITSLARTIEVSFGSTSNVYGFGDAQYFDSTNTHCSNAYFCEGDDLYITCRSNVIDAGLYPCILKVDLSTGSSEVFAKSATRATRAISYDGTRMLITNGTSLIINDNFTSQVGAITI